MSTRSLSRGILSIRRNIWIVTNADLENSKSQPWERLSENIGSRFPP